MTGTCPKSRAVWVIGRSTLYRKLKDLGLETGDREAAEPVEKDEAPRHAAG